jgi:GT2 family glycosyltransferase
MTEDEYPLISIVIVNYNGREFLENCLKSVYESNYPNYEVILVDNASTDQSDVIAKQKFPKINLVKNDKNLGPGGRNSGILQAKGNFVILLDSDTVVSSDWINEFLNSYKRNGYGLYQGKLLFMDKPSIINSTGCMINIFGFSFARGSGEIDNKQYDELEKINFPASACAFMPKDVFNKVGLFDIEFFAYVEDTDFGWRALMHGIKSFFVPNVIVYHKGSPNTKWSPRKFYLLERNRLICLHTNYTKKTFCKLIPFMVVVEIGILLFYLKKGMIVEKLRTYDYIIKKQKYLKERYTSLHANQIMGDQVLIKQFSDAVWVPAEVFEKNINSLFNRILTKLSRCAKSFVQSS